MGSPATVTARLRELHTELGGFGKLIGLFAIGPSTHEQVTRSAELFASEVIPALRPLGVAQDAAAASPAELTGGAHADHLGIAPRHTLRVMPPSTRMIAPVV